MGTLHLSCAVYFRSPQAVCTKYASNFLASGVMQYVVLRRICACVSILLTTNHNTLSAFWRFLAKVSGPVYPISLWRIKTRTVLSVRSWRLSRWVTHTHAFAVPRKANTQWNFGVSVADDASREYPSLSFRKVFFASKIATAPRYWHLSKVSWGFHNQKNVKIIVLNDFEVLLQHSSGRFQVE